MALDTNFVNIFKLLRGLGRWAIPLDKGLFEEIPDHFESERATKTSNLSPNDDEEGTTDKDGSVYQQVPGATIDQLGLDKEHSAIL
ncbi:hypothetical protein Tco_0316506 [Tanacetum coccineum]